MLSTSESRTAAMDKLQALVLSGRQNAGTRMASGRIAQRAGDWLRPILSRARPMKKAATVDR
jgi:hypothetical protein